MEFHEEERWRWAFFSKKLKAVQKREFMVIILQGNFVVFAAAVIGSSYGYR